MKSPAKTLIVAAVVAAVAQTALAGFSRKAQDAVARLVRIPLSQLASMSDSPEKGEIWCNCDKSTRVSQIIGGGVVAETPKGGLGAKRIFIDTPRTYADGDVLGMGLYRVTGTRAFTDLDGVTRTIHAFEELPAELTNEIIALLEDRDATAKAMAQADAERQRLAAQTSQFQQSKERIKAEEEAQKRRIEAEKQAAILRQELAKQKAESDKRVADMKSRAEAEMNLRNAEHAREMARLAKEREEQDKENQARIAAAKAEKAKAEAKLAVDIQKDRERYARDVLGALDLNFKHYYLVQKSIRKAIKIEVVDPLWAKLVALQKAQDWLGMLGAMEGDELDEYPEEKDIDATIEDFRLTAFEVDVKVIDSKISNFRVSYFSHPKSNGGWTGWMDGDRYNSTMMRKWSVLYSKYYIAYRYENTFVNFAERNGLPNFHMDREAKAQRQEDLVAQYEAWLKAN